MGCMSEYGSDIYAIYSTITANITAINLIYRYYQADLVGWLSTRRAFSWGRIGSPVRMSSTPKTSSSRDTLKASQVAYRVSVHFRNHFLQDFRDTGWNIQRSDRTCWEGGEEGGGHRGRRIQGVWKHTRGWRSCIRANNLSFKIAISNLIFHRDVWWYQNICLSIISTAGALRIGAVRDLSREPSYHPSTYSFWAFKPVYTKAFRSVSGSMWQSGNFWQLTGT